MAGIAVYALGYHFPEYDEALKAQIDKVLHTSNLYYHEPLANAAKAVVTSTGLSKVFFTNSGAEAIEGALKAARKYAWLKDGKRPRDHRDEELLPRTIGRRALRHRKRPLSGSLQTPDGRAWLVRGVQQF